MNNTQKPTVMYTSMLMKAAVVIAAAWGVWRCTNDPNAFMGGKNAWLYFTIQSNVWVGICLLIGLVMQLTGKKASRAYAVAQLVVTVSITLTGFVYCFILAPTIEHGAFNLTNVLVHIVTPVCAEVDYLLVCRSMPLKTKDAWWALLPPLYYFGFAAVGYVAHWPFAPGDINYPYFFLNWGSEAGAFGFCKDLPYMGVVWYVVITMAVLYGLSRLLVWLAKR